MNGDRRRERLVVEAFWGGDLFNTLYTSIVVDFELFA
jgi:hypothetical protein